MNEQVDENYGYFTIRLSIHHPDIDPQIITNELGLEPYMSWKANEKRINPRGVELPGLAIDSRWNHVFDFQNVDTRLFFKKLAEIINPLTPHRTFFKKIVNEGGRVCIGIHLPGSVNQGSNLSIEALQKLSDMNIELGLEVFPDWYED